MDNQTLLTLAHRHLPANTPLEVLEIGCADMNVLTDLIDHTSLTFVKLKGVDNNEYFCCDPQSDYYNVVHTDDPNYQPKDLPDNTLQFELAEGFAYLTTETSKYDLIIFSNYLHFRTEEEFKIHLEVATSKLKEGGSIYVWMVNEGKDNSKGQFITPLNTNLARAIFNRFGGKELLEFETHTAIWLRP